MSKTAAQSVAPAAQVPQKRELQAYHHRNLQTKIVRQAVVIQFESDL
jgi:hypothetical protein